MKIRQLRYGQSVGVLHREWLRPDCLHAVRNVTLRIVRQSDPADLGLDSDLPGASSREEQLVARVLKRAKMVSKPLRFGQ